MIHANLSAFVQRFLNKAVIRTWLISFVPMTIVFFSMGAIFGFTGHDSMVCAGPSIIVGIAAYHFWGEKS